MLLVWQCIYYGQIGRREDNNTDGDPFCIILYQGRRATRMFIESAVLLLCSWKWALDAGVGRLAMLAWIFRMACAHSWIEDSPTIFLFAKTFEETQFLLDELVTCLAEVGLQLNVRKTKVLTTQSQSPSEVLLRYGQTIEVSYRGCTHTWLGCMLCTANTGNHVLALVHHRHATSKTFFANRPYLVDRNVAMRDRMPAMVTLVACFGAAHKKVYKQDLCKMDIVFGRLLRSIVGPPGDVDWTMPWHEILRQWNEGEDFFHKSPWLQNMVCRVFETMPEISALCFRLAKGAMRCA